MKFNKAKCKFLHLGGNNPRHQDMLRAKQLESSFAEKDLGFLVASKLNMSEHPCSKKKANSIIGTN